MTLFASSWVPVVGHLNVHTTIRSTTYRSRTATGTLMRAREGPRNELEYFVYELMMLLYQTRRLPETVWLVYSATSHDKQ